MSRPVFSLFLLLVCDGWLTPLLRAEEESMEQRYLNIYIEMKDGERLEQSSSYKNAAARFQDCLSQLETMHEQNPQWEAAIVETRIDYFKSKLLELQPKLAEAEPTPDTNPASPAITSTDPSFVAPDIDSLPDDPKVLKSKLSEVEQQLNSTKKQLQDSQLQVQNLRAQLDTVNQQLQQAHSPSGDDRVAELLSENKQLNDKLRSAQSQINSLTSTGPDSNLTSLRAQLKDVQDRLNTSETANVALKQNNDLLSQQLQQAKADLAQGTPASGNNANNDELVRENKLLRGIVNRETQEQAKRDLAKRLAEEELGSLHIKSSVMQQQLDILGSPMTPLSDDEKAVLRSPGLGLTQVDGNVLTAPKNPSTATTPTPLATATAPTAPVNPPVTADNPPTSPATIVQQIVTNAAPAQPDAPPTTTSLPPAATSVTDTTVTTTVSQPPDTAPDPTQFSVQPRLPDDMRSVAKDAAASFQQQKFDDAAKSYQTIIDKYPNCLYAWSNLGVVRFQQGNMGEAMVALQQAVKLNPSDDVAHRNLGIVYYYLNRYESAIDELTHAIAVKPTDAQSHNYLGCACTQKGWTEVAEKEFRKAVELDDTFADAHFNLAMLYANAKPPSIELARRHYQRALQLGVAKDPSLQKLLNQ